MIISDIVDSTFAVGLGPCTHLIQSWLLVDEGNGFPGMCSSNNKARQLGVTWDGACMDGQGKAG